MLFSLSLIFIVGLALGTLFSKIKLPSLIGMLITGIILGPHVFNLIDNSVLSISSELRKIALIIILTRAGLALNFNDLKKVGRPSILMSFVPACFEIIGMVIIAPRLLGISILDAAIIGTVVGAVSPAVIVPKMLNLIENNYGTKKSIPQMIMASASIDDIFVIVLFTSFIGLAQGNKISAFNFLKIPLSIFLGLIIGMAIGIIIVKIFKSFKVKSSIKVIILSSISFLLVTLEDIIPISGLIAVMGIGISILKNNNKIAQELSSSFSQIWNMAEILLFVLVGAAVNLNYALSAGFSAILLILCVLVFRVVGVYICLLKTKLNFKEKVFCMISYIPKATVQAAIGSIPLSMGLSCGNIVLTVAVLAILITAPLGALGIDIIYKGFLKNDEAK